MKFSDLDNNTQTALTFGYLAGLRVAVFLDDNEIISMMHTEETVMHLSPRYTMYAIADIEGFNDRDRCGTCRFYADGHCHRNPPSAYPHNIYGPENREIPKRVVFIPFPPTLPAQWCGAYERQKG